MINKYNFFLSLSHQGESAQHVSHFILSGVISAFGHFLGVSSFIHFIKIFVVARMCLYACCTVYNLCCKCNHLVFVLLLRQPRTKPVLVVRVHDGQPEKFSDDVRCQTYCWAYRDTKIIILIL